MPDQIIDAVMACALQADVMRTHPLVGWIVMREQPNDPDAAIARLVTDVATSYVLRADTAAAIHALLPPGLQRSARQPSDPPEVAEVWLPKPPAGDLSRHAGLAGDLPDNQISHSSLRV